MFISVYNYTGTSCALANPDKVSIRIVDKRFLYYNMFFYEWVNIRLS